jgi:hypothetical protein
MGSDQHKWIVVALIPALVFGELVPDLCLPPGIDSRRALIRRGMGPGILWLLAAFISRDRRASAGGSNAVRQRRAT